MVNFCEIVDGGYFQKIDSLGISVHSHHFHEHDIRATTPWNNINGTYIGNMYELKEQLICRYAS
jgi:hypothetical protein